jgi:putative glutamine amidotransferase
VARPVIGITTYLTRAAWGAWEQDAALVPAEYVRAVSRVGGVPLLVPPGPGVSETLDSLDAVIFSGGSDLDPDLYGEEAHAETTGIVRERDDFELELMREALARDMPILAICRGSQVLNVALGGDLEQHVPDRVGTNVHKETPGVFADHHQGFGDLGTGLREAARASDGTVEALEDPTRRFTLGVLWHPEAGEDLALFETLVREAAKYRSARPRVHS